MKKYLIIAFSLLVVLLGAVACEKQGAEEEELPGVSANGYSCTDNENGIEWKLYLISTSICEIVAKTSKGSCSHTNVYLIYNNRIYSFAFPVEIPANISTSGKDEKYYFYEGVVKDPALSIKISRYNDDGSLGSPKTYCFI